MKENLYINGPMFACRLKGTVNDVEKIVYLFGDYHLEPEMQTECEDFSSVDLHKYMFQLLKRTSSNNMIDLFFETYNEPVELIKDRKKKYKYIWQTNKFFEKYSNLNKDTKTGDIRMHYIDFRDKGYVFLREMFENLNTYWTQLEYNRNMEMYESDVEILINRIKTIKMEIENAEFKFDKEYDKLKIPHFQKLYYYYKKIIDKYENPDVKIKLYNSDLYKLILETYNNVMLSLTIFLDKLEQKYIVNNYTQPNRIRYHHILHILHNYIPYIYNILGDYFVYIIDLYALRRLLDKEYVKKSIIYTGFHHTCDYLYTLVKNFDFEITHISYSIRPKIINEYINKYSINEFPYHMIPSEIYQCINLKDFPDDFR
jgi:hypothetical protein